jgi:DNA-binding CsgD family transcriptional regulator
MRGEAGIGKSALVSAALQAARNRGIRTGHAAAEQLESRLLFHAISACLGVSTTSSDSRLTRIAEMARREWVSSGNLSLGKDVEVEVTEALVTLVEDWCAQAPLLLALDDLQWADSASVVVLHLLGRMTEQYPLCLLVATRPVAPEGVYGALLESFDTRRNSLTIDVPPLSPEATVALGESIAGASARPRLRRILGDTGGNAHYIHELVKGLARSGLLVVDGAGAEADARAMDESLPGFYAKSLIDAIRLRQDFVAEDTHAVLAVAGLIGSSFDVGEVAAVSGLSPSAVSDCLLAASQAGLLDESGDKFVFRHGLIRQAMVARLPKAVRAAIHQRAAHVLMTTAAPTGRVAAHLQAAGSRLDELSVRWIAQHADELIVLAPDTAVDVMTAAIRISSGPVYDELAVKLGTALAWSGRYRESLRHARLAMGTVGDEARRTELRFVLIESAYWACDLELALREIDLVLSGAALPPLEQLRLNVRKATCLGVLGRTKESGAVFEDFPASGAAAFEDPSLEAELSLAVATSMFFAGRFDEAERVLERGLESAARGRCSPNLLLSFYTALGATLKELDRIDHASAVLLSAQSVSEQVSGSAGMWFHSLRAYIAFRTGEWDDAITAAGDILGDDTWRRADDRYLVAADSQGVKGLVAVHRGDLRAARECFPGGRVDANTRGPRYNEYWVVWSRALLAEAEGRPDEAASMLHSFWRDGGNGIAHEELYFLGPDLVRIAARIGDRALVAEVADTLTGQAASRGHPTLEACASFAAATAHGDIELFRTAAEQFHAGHWPLFEAYAMSQIAIAAATRGETDTAHTALERALEHYERLEAHWDARQLASALRRAGMASGVRGIPRRPRFGWHALTETERKVAALVADGMSNPAIGDAMSLPRRTVEGHVSSVLAKLNLDARVDIAVEVARRGD